MELAYRSLRNQPSTMPDTTASMSFRVCLPRRMDEDDRGESCVQRIFPSVDRVPAGRTYPGDRCTEENPRAGSRCADERKKRNVCYNMTMDKI